MAAFDFIFQLHGRHKSRYCKPNSISYESVRVRVQGSGERILQGKFSEEKKVRPPQLTMMPEYAVSVL
jgi:hypothetical protein